MERMFYVRYEEVLKNVICQYHTHQVSKNNRQRQIGMDYNDLFYDANKEE